MLLNTPAEERVKQETYWPYFLKPGKTVWGQKVRSVCINSCNCWQSDDAKLVSIAKNDEETENEKAWKNDVSNRFDEHKPSLQ